MPDKTPITRDMFEIWLIHMPFALDEFLNALPEEISCKLDYSVESLDVLEVWILDTYPSTKELQDNLDIWDKIARYIGRTFLTHIGGVWDIDLDNPENAFFHLPVITDHYEKLPVDICPHTLAAASTHRKRVGYIREVLENM